ncbi:hypothetical protein TcCL_Unassigned03683, partial [Trypanosoma cruzi]
MSRRQRGQAAEKAHVARRRHPDGIPTSLVSPSSMRVSVPQQCLTDPLPHDKPRASTGHCEKPADRNCAERQVGIYSAARLCRRPEKSMERTLEKWGSRTSRKYWCVSTLKWKVSAPAVS